MSDDATPADARAPRRHARRSPAAAALALPLFALGCGGAERADDGTTAAPREPERIRSAERLAEQRQAPSAEEGDDSPGFDVRAHAFRPEARVADEGLLATLELPEGFSIAIAGRDLGHARMMSMRDDGAFYLTRPRSGDVLLVRDADGDGTYEATTTVASELPGVHGIAQHEGWLYVATNQEVHRAQMRRDGRVGPWQRLVDDLPEGGQHPNRTLAFGPDGRLYVSVGSSCNACDETTEEHATLLVGDARLRDRSVFARGLRNTIGFAWHPQTNALWGMDHGSDWRGDGIPPEELNRLEEGKHYGWPYAYGDRHADPVEGAPPGESIEDFLARTEPSVLEYDAHAAPMAFLFYEANAFPEELRGDAFVAFRGSWNRYPPAGYEIVRIDFEDGEPRRFVPFVRRFLTDDHRAHFARLVGLAVTPDGDLLATDDTNGVLFRISHEPG